MKQLLILCAMLPLAAAEAAAATPRELLRQGVQAGEKGDARQAKELFEQALATATNDTRAASAAAYNLGALHYRAGEKEPAAEKFKAALRTEDLTIQHDAYHNQGNLRMQASTAQEQAGKLDEAVKEVAAAVENYDNAMLLDPAAQDTRVNLELALNYARELKLKLEEQKRQEEEKKKQEEEKKDQNKDEQQKSEEQKKQEQEQKEKEEQEKKDQEKKEQENGGEQKQPGQQDEQKDPSQQQPQPDPQKSEQQDPSKDRPEPGKDEQAKDFTNPKEQQGKPGEMTPAQAMQLLDAQREEEKAARERFRINLGRPEKVEKDY